MGLADLEEDGRCDETHCAFEGFWRTGGLASPVLGDGQRKRGCSAPVQQDCATQAHTDVPDRNHGLMSGNLSRCFPRETVFAPAIVAFDR